jgi:hypothetical protein
VFPGSTAPHPGSNTAAYFATRGVQLSPDESRDLVQVLLRLSDLGAISAAPTDEGRGSSPNTPASAGVSCAGRGAGVGRARSARHALGEANAYNIASLIPSGDSE